MATQRQIGLPASEDRPARRILTHVGESAAPPRISPPRGPPALENPAVDAVTNRDALSQSQPEWIFGQQVQW